MDDDYFLIELIMENGNRYTVGRTQGHAKAIQSATHILSTKTKGLTYTTCYYDLSGTRIETGVVDTSTVQAVFVRRLANGRKGA